MTQSPVPRPDPSVARTAGVRPPAPPAGRLARALYGAGYLARGFRTYLRTDGVRVLGIVPVLIVGSLYWIALLVLLMFVDELARLVTPFADTWSEGGRLLARALAGLAVLGLYGALAILTFATLVNLVGQPFYERISDRLEKRLGDPPAGTDAPWWRTLPQATLESLALFALILACWVPTFVLGVLPLVGPMIGAIVSGWFLAVELLAIPLQRRGLNLTERLRWMWGQRDVTVGFGVASFLLFLVPLMNVLAMPAAVVGGTLLVRGLNGQRIE